MVYFDQMQTYLFNIVQSLVCKKGDEASRNIISGGRGNLVKTFITLEPHSIC